MKKLGGQLDIRPPNLKIGGGRVPPIPPRIDAPGDLLNHNCNTIVIYLNRIRLICDLRT